MSFLAKDYWQTYRKPVRIGKLNRSLIIPAFSVVCGRPKQCLEFKSSYTESLKEIGPGKGDITNKFLIEIWFYPKTLLLGRRQSLLAMRMDAKNDWKIDIGFLGPNPFIYLKDNSGVTHLFESTLILDPNTWQHLAIKWDGSNITFFKNGVPESISYSFSEVLDSDYQSDAFQLGSKGLAAENPTNYFFGYIGDVRVWNVPPLNSDILFMYNKRRNPLNTVPLDVCLIRYYDFREPTDVSPNFHFLNLRNNDVYFITDDTYVHLLRRTDISSPIGLGGSFIAAEFSTSLEVPCSLKFPIKKPSSDCNFCLCVRWEDDSGNPQRRRFWTVGENIGPELPAFYNGERLSENFVFEIWNIDGNYTVDLNSDLIIETSILENAEDSLDEDSVSLGTLVEDSSIYADFDFDFTQAFNEEYDYLQETPGSQPAYLIDESGHVIVDIYGNPIIVT